MNASRTKPFLVTWATCILLTAIAFAKYGWPANVYTWAWFCIALALCSLVRFYGWRCIPIPLMIFGPIFVPYESHAIRDIRGGRDGTALFPGLFVFFKLGENTELVANYLGKVEPEWRREPYIHSFMGITKPDEDVLHCNSILFQSELGPLLKNLPDDATRKQVLICVTSPGNRLKFLQESHLRSWMNAGYPAGWWEQNRMYFRPECDPKYCGNRD